MGWGVVDDRLLGISFFIYVCLSKMGVDNATNISALIRNVLVAIRRPSCTAQQPMQIFAGDLLHIA